MLFNSLTFVVFFAVVVSVYWSMRSWNARKYFLVVASYVFYGAWNPPFAALLFSTTAMDFWLGRRIATAKGRRSRRVWLVGSVCMRSEEHTSELQSRYVTSYAVFCWKKKKK